MKLVALPAVHPTARELLETIGGPAHALHSVVGWSARGYIYVDCSCGDTFKIESNSLVMAALRNAPKAETPRDC